MKLLVISDTHRNLINAQRVLKSIAPMIDGVIHLGDHDDDAKELQKEFRNIPFYIVAGNNDYLTDTPTARKIEINGRTLLLTHGHKHNVYFGLERLYYFAREQGADAALFGHTHMPTLENADDLLIFNPGSISLPRATPRPTYGVLDIDDDGNMEAHIMRIERDGSVTNTDNMKF